MSELTEQVKSRIQAKYDYLTTEEVDTCYDLALSDYVLYRYPSANNRPPVEKLEIDFYIAQWLYKRMEDILGRIGGTNLTAYRENGISFTFGSSYIDPQLVAEIMPTGCVPR